MAEILPFDSAQFFANFGTYNARIWPVQIVAYLLGLGAIGFLFRRGARADRTTAAILAAMWLWTGVAYHWFSFTLINGAAYLFGLAFVAQGLVFLEIARSRRLMFGYVRGVRGAAGIGLIVYSGLAYPLLGSWLGHAYPELPTFGVTPCPVTIFTFGCLLLTVSPMPWWIMAIPLLWSLVGGTAAFLLSVPQDWGLMASGVIAVTLLSMHPRGARRGSSHVEASSRP